MGKDKNFSKIAGREMCAGASLQPLQCKCLMHAARRKQVNIAKISGHLFPASPAQEVLTQLRGMDVGLSTIHGLLFVPSGRCSTISGKQQDFAKLLRQVLWRMKIAWPQELCKERAIEGPFLPWAGCVWRVDGKPPG
jgi:hypothetical protein